MDFGRLRRVVPDLSGREWVALSALVGSVAVLVAIGGARSWSRDRADAANAFVGYAVVAVDNPVELLDRPGGKAIATVVGGTRMGVGGRLRSDADALLWVEVAVNGRLVRGFVPERLVTYVAGSAPPMEADDPSALSGEVVVEAPAGALGIPWLPAPLAQWSDTFEEAGERHAVDPALLAIISLVESGGQPDVQSGAGAVGLMQIMPATAGDIARWRGMDAPVGADLLDPERNIDFGAYYAARMLSSFAADGDQSSARSVEIAAMAYNGGPGAARRWLEGRPVPAETERYRAFVLGMWQERKRAHSVTFERWCKAGGSRLLPPPHCPVS